MTSGFGNNLRKMLLPSLSCTSPQVFVGIGTLSPFWYLSTYIHCIYILIVPPLLPRGTYHVSSKTCGHIHIDVGGLVEGVMKLGCGGLHVAEGGNGGWIKKSHRRVTMSVVMKD